MKLILGSKSPRRKEILEMAGYDFDIVLKDVDEHVEAKSIKEMSMKIAKKKCDAIFIDHQDDTIICADTIVVMGDMVLEKPKDKVDARRMIKLIQNNTHEVYTSLIVKNKYECIEHLEHTKVIVGPMTDDEIEEYINMKEPYDKAGAYAIQGYFAKYIKGIEGDYYNVMGLPLYKLNQILKEIKKEDK